MFIPVVHFLTRNVWPVISKSQRELKHLLELPKSLKKKKFKNIKSK